MITKNIRKLLDFLPVAPVLLASSYIVFLFLHNIGELTINRLWNPLLYAIIIALLLSLILRILMRNTRKGDIFTSVLIILFFSYGEAAEMLGKFHLEIGSVNLGKDQIVLSLWLVLIIGVLILIIRTRRKLSSLNRAFQIIGFAIVIMPAIGIIQYQIIQRVHPPVTSPLMLPALTTASDNGNNLPDVYYIIPDSYASPGNLSAYFSYDDSTFVTYLKKKGFYIAGESMSNYPTTLLSLSSTLNMEYIDYLSVYKNSKDQSIASPLIEDNNVIKMFKSLGYKYYQMGSWWLPTQSNRNADENYNIQKQYRLGLDEFTYIIVKSSMISPVLDRFFPEKVIGESEKDKRTIINYQFDTIPQIAALPGPKFVFIHIIAPHAPYVLDQNCSPVTYAQNWYKPEEKNYTDQVNCINNKLKQNIDIILKDSSRPPVILLQADEGAKFIADKLTPKENWKTASGELLKMKFPILSAYYLPAVSKKKMYPGITPVNSFRMIFNLYFKAEMPLLPDKNFIYLDAKHLYDFADVTDKVKS